MFFNQRCKFCRFPVKRGCNASLEKMSVQRLQEKTKFWMKHGRKAFVKPCSRSQVMYEIYLTNRDRIILLKR